MAIKLTSRGPIVYSQTRLGRGGRPYTIYKLRTMYHNCEQESGAQWSTNGDQTDVARADCVQPNAPRPRRTALHDLQAPHDVSQLRAGIRGAMVHQGRSN